SGGIDSSAILVSLAENGFKPEIFSLKFDEEKYNENNYRDSLLKKLGFKNNEIIMTAKNYSDTLKEIINHNQITQLTQDVASFKFLCDKADLKGQSIIFGLPGDECFFGYKYMIEPYIDMDFYFKYRKNILEKINFGGITEILTNEILEKLQNLWNYIPSYLNNNEIKELINYELKTESENTLNLTECKNLFDVKKEIQKFQFNIMLPCNQFNRLNTIEKLTENNILLPFMNREIYKYALSLPFEYCYNQNKEKWILYQAFKKDITEEIFQKSKQGFKIPIKNWLSTPDFDFIKKQLIQQSHDINSEFSINPDYIKTLYNPLTEQTSYKLWYILGVRSSIFGF
ncbi:MAG: asparagine synthase C-terminal domain-containing protein, partial [Candidatus Muiribacteriota bacterium]